MPNPWIEAFNAAAGPPVPFCLTCLGPRRDAVQILVIDGPAPVPRCVACDGPLDAEGLSALRLTEKGVEVPPVIQLEQGVPRGEEVA